MANEKYISKIVVNGVTYLLKDSMARESALHFVLATDAATTPKGVRWMSGAVEIVGTLEAIDGDKSAIYLVPQSVTEPGDTYSEYAVVNTGTSSTPAYIWEKLGDTSADLSGVVTDVTLNKTKVQALGSSATFTDPKTYVVFENGTNASVIKSVNASKSKMVVDTITGISGSESITPVTDTTAVTASKLTMKTDKTASKVVNKNYTASKITVGTGITLSPVTLGNAVDYAAVGDTTSNIITMTAAKSSILTDATVNESTETLTIGSTTITKASVTGASNGGSFRPASYGTDITVPQFTATDVTVVGIDSNTDVTVKDFSATDVVADKVTLGAAVSLAKPAASAKSFATGALASNATGAEIATGVTSSTASVVSSVGSAYTASHTITVGGTSSVVDVVDYNSLTVDVTKHE